MRFTDLYPPHVITMARERLKTCASCPVMRIDQSVFGVPVGMTCGMLGAEIPGKTCGCILKIKAYLPMFDCPQKKWK